MHNFEWNLPTRIVYGRGELAHLWAVSKEYGKKVFLATYRRKETREERSPAGKRHIGTDSKRP